MSSEALLEARYYLASSYSKTDNLESSINQIQILDRTEHQMTDLFEKIRRSIARKAAKPSKR